MANQDEQDDIVKLLQQAKETKWAYADVKARFDAVEASTYGEWISGWLPDYAYTHDLLLKAMGLYLPESGVVLDLGAGTGRFSKRVLESFDDCHIILVDFSENMLEEAPKKLAALAGRFDLIHGDFFDDTINFPTNSFDCVVSVFAICHGRGVETYRRLYQKVHRWLKPAGAFIVYDHVLGGNEHLTGLNAAGWRSFMDSTDAKAWADDIILTTYQEDTPLPLAQHLNLLSKAGFKTTDVLYKRDVFAIYTGIKA